MNEIEIQHRKDKFFHKKVLTYYLLSVILCSERDNFFHETCKYATKKNCKAVCYCGRLEKNHGSKEND